MMQTVDPDTEDEVSSYQPYLSITKAQPPHIVTNPYEMRQDILSSPGIFLRDFLLLNYKN